MDAASRMLKFLTITTPHNRSMSHFALKTSITARVALSGQFALLMLETSIFPASDFLTIVTSFFFFHSGCEGRYFRIEVHRDHQAVLSFAMRLPQPPDPILLLILVPPLSQSPALRKLRAAASHIPSQLQFVDRLIDSRRFGYSRLRTVVVCERSC
jgi:hypothetical protein